MEVSILDTWVVNVGFQFQQEGKLGGGAKSLCGTTGHKFRTVSEN